MWNSLHMRWQKKWKIWCDKICNMVSKCDMRDEKYVWIWDTNVMSKNDEICTIPNTIAPVYLGT